MPMRKTVTSLLLIATMTGGAPTRSAQAGPLFDWLFFGHRQQPAAPAYPVGRARASCSWLRAYAAGYGAPYAAAYAPTQPPTHRPSLLMRRTQPVMHLIARAMHRP